VTTAGPGIDERGSASLRIGIDLGGTKIEAIAIDAQGAQRVRSSPTRRLRPLGQPGSGLAPLARSPA